MNSYFTEDAKLLLFIDPPFTLSLWLADGSFFVILGVQGESLPKNWVAT